MSYYKTCPRCRTERGIPAKGTDPVSTPRLPLWESESERSYK